MFNVTDMPKDTIIADIDRRLRKVVDGNGLTKKDVSITSSMRKDHRLQLSMEVRLNWRSNVNTYAGRPKVTDGLYFENESDLKQKLGMVANATCTDVTALHRVAEEFSGDPSTDVCRHSERFDAWNLPNTYYCVEHCNNCGGNGNVPCSGLMCRSGKVPCNQCINGYHNCHHCHGTKSIYANGQYGTCGYCGGSGRGHICITCHGSMQKTCPTCNGHSYVTCRDCAGKGQFTHCFTATITGLIKWSCTLPETAPDALRSALNTWKIESTALYHATGFGKAERHINDDHARFDWTGTIPHAEITFGLRDRSYSLMALGLRAEIPRMPAFLDDLLVDALSRMSIADADSVFPIALESRIGQQVAKQVTSGHDKDLNTIARDYEQAVSISFLDRIHALLDRAYERLGAGTISRFWMVGLPTVILGAFMLPAYDLGSAILGLAPEWAAAVPPPLTNLVLPVLILFGHLSFFFAAALWSRRTVRRAIGFKSKRMPTQGWRPWIAALGAVIGFAMGSNLPMVKAIWAGQWSEIMATAPAAALPPKAAPALNTEATKPSAPAPQPRPKPVKLDLPPSDKPQLTRRPMPEAMRASAPAQRINYRLRQIFYHLDGIKAEPHAGIFPGSDSEITLLRTVVQQLPARDSREMATFTPAGGPEMVADLFEAVYADRIRLVSLANDTMAKPLSNIIRFNIRSGDIDAIDAAIATAMGNGGKPVTWGLTGSRVQGRVIATPQGDRCATIVLEVEFAREVETTPVQRGCMQGKAWRPSPQKP